MAFYPRPDGLFDVDLPGGGRVPMALTPEQLQSVGQIPAELQGLPPGALAQNDTPKGDEQAISDALTGGAPPPKPAPIPATPDTVPLHIGETTYNVPKTFGQAEMNQFKGGVEKLKAEAPQKNTEGEIDPSELVPVNLRGMGGAGGGYGPRRTYKVKGGDTRASFVRTPGVKVGDDVKSDLVDDTPEDLENAAINIAFDREEMRQQREKDLVQQQADIDAAKARRVAIDQRINEKRKLIDDRDKEVEKLNPRTAKEVIEDRGILGRMLAGITIALGGYNQGRNGGPNAGLEMIQQSIRDEVDDERARYEYAVERGEQARGDYAKAVETYGDPEAAALDFQMRRYAVAEKMLQARAEGIDDQKWLQQVNQQAAELRKARAETKLKLQELEEGKTLQENWVNVPDRYVTTGGPPKVKDMNTLVRLPNGEYMRARDASRSDKLQETIKANASIVANARRLQGLTDTVGKREPTAAERAQAETIRQELVFTYKSAEKAGTVDNGLIELMKGYFGEPEAVFGVRDSKAKLSEVERLARGKINDTVNYDLHPLAPDEGAPQGTPMFDARKAESDE